MLVTYICTLCFFVLRYAVGQANPGQFTQPSSSLKTIPVYKEGDNLDIKWETSMEHYFMFLAPLDESFKGGADILLGYIDATTNNQSEWQWTVTATVADLDQWHMFILTIMDGNNATSQFSSQRFNITKKDATSTTSTSTGQSSSTSLPASSSDNNGSESSSGLSPEAKVGVGVGVGVGGALLIALGALAWYSRRRIMALSTAAAQSGPPPDSKTPAFVAEKDGGTHQPELGTQQPGLDNHRVELPAQGFRHELPQ